MLPNRPSLDVRASRPKLSASDQRLLSGLQAGDRKLTEELWQRLKITVDSTLCRIMGRGDPDHHDLVQTCFEHIVSGLRRGKFAGECGISTWAAAITGHLALRAIRTRRMERRVFDRSYDVKLLADEIQGPNDPESELAARRELERVQRSLGNMSNKLSEALLLYDVLGFGLEETMALTGSSKVALQSRLTRARRELSGRLERQADSTSSRADGDSNGK